MKAKWGVYTLKIKAPVEFELQKSYQLLYLLDIVSIVGGKRRRRLTFWGFCEIKQPNDHLKTSVDKQPNQIPEKKHQYALQNRVA